MDTDNLTREIVNKIQELIKEGDLNVTFCNCWAYNSVHLIILKTLREEHDKESRKLTDIMFRPGIAEIRNKLET